MIERDSNSSASQPAKARQRIGAVVLTFALLVAGIWTIRSFLAALAWAAIFAIASWPLYRHFERLFTPFGQRVFAPLIFTVAVGLLFAVPFSFVAVEIARVSQVVISLVTEARKSGIAVPDWVAQFPYLGDRAAALWRHYLSSPETARALFGHINTATIAESAREFGGAILHRLTIFFFTLLALFFLLRDGKTLTARLIGLSDRLLGHSGERIATHMISGVRGALNGLVLVGLGEGAVLGIAYLAVGLPNAVPIGALTGVLAVIPFGAPVVFCGAAFYLLSTGAVAGAIAVLVVGFGVVFFADHFIRPILIGGAAHLPFLWVLLGILGGIETFGVLGLFLGPAIMAALMAIWRDWTGRPAVETPSAVRRGRPPSRG